MTDQIRYEGLSLDNERAFIEAALVELCSARKRYPEWPTDIVHAAAVMCEEAGEVLKAALEIHWQHKGTLPDELEKEVIHTIAMCLRLLTETPALAQ